MIVPFEDMHLNPAFRRWQSLSDAYAAKLEALRRREPGASADLQQLCRDLARCQGDIEASKPGSLL